MKVMRTLGLAGGIMLGLAVATVAPATAAPIENEHFHESESEVFDDFCEDMAVVFQHEADIHELVKPRGPTV